MSITLPLFFRMDDILQKFDGEYSPNFIQQFADCGFVTLYFRMAANDDGYMPFRTIEYTMATKFCQPLAQGRVYQSGVLPYQNGWRFWAGKENPIPQIKKDLTTIDAAFECDWKEAGTEFDTRLAEILAHGYFKVTGISRLHIKASFPDGNGIKSGTATFAKPIEIEKHLFLTEGDFEVLKAQSWKSAKTAASKTTVLEPPISNLGKDRETATPKSDKRKAYKEYFEMVKDFFDAGLHKRKGDGERTAFQNDAMKKLGISKGTEENYYKSAKINLKIE